MKRVSYKLMVPKKIRLAGSLIDVRIEKMSDSGEWLSDDNVIRIGEHLQDQVKGEVFLHEVAEAINTKYVNQSSGGAQATHEVIDAFGRGLFDFLVNNATEILKVDTCSQ